MRYLFMSILALLMYGCTTKEVIIDFEDTAVIAVEKSVDGGTETSYYSTVQKGKESTYSIHLSTTPINEDGRLQKLVPNIGQPTNTVE